MQILLPGKQIEESAYKDFLLEILADKYSRAVLESTRECPKSAKQLSQECNMPICTTYRRVQGLYDRKLLSISGTINENGKKFFLYKSKVSGITSCFNKGSVEVEIIPNNS